MRPIIVLRVCLLWLGVTSLASPSFARDLLTFEVGASSEQLAPLGMAELDYWTPESATSESDSRPQGRAVRMSGPAGCGFITKTDPARVDWRKVESLSVWVHRTADEAKRHPTVALDCRLLEADRQTHFTRKVELSHVGWQQVLLPLDWFRWGDSRVPRWDQVCWIALVLRDPGTITLDTLSASPSEMPREDFPTASSIGPLAFPSSDDATGEPQPRSLETREVELLTNATSLDLEQLAGHLGSVTKEVRRELPFLPVSPRAPLLIVFQTRDEYRRFVPRFARQLSGRLDAPDSDGYTVQGVSISSWDDRHRTLRPVYTHEFLHGYLCRTSRLPLHGDWLHEGLATYFQLRFHPQEELKELIVKGLGSPERRLPLKTLCNGQRLPLDRYWQAATLCQLLLTDERYSSRLPVLFERLRDAKTTDLAPHLEPVWQTNWDDLTKAWRSFCETK